MSRPTMTTDKLTKDLSKESERAKALQHSLYSMLNYLNGRSYSNIKSNQTRDILYEKMEEARMEARNQNNRIIYERTTETKYSTTGKFYIPGTNIKGYILEPAGPSTTQRGLDRRVPAGVYNLTDNKGGTKVGLKLYNDLVPKDRAILIHSGNLPSETLGCLMPGHEIGIDYVGGNSRRMVEKIMLHFNKVGLKGATIEIIDINQKR